MAYRLLVLGLLTALAVQLMLARRLQVTEFTEVPIELNREFPFQMTRLQGESPLAWGDPGGCGQAFLCTTRCAYCSQLATRFADSIQSRTLPAAQPIWLIEGDPETVYGWAEEHGLSKGRVFAIGPRRSPWWTLPTAGDIWFTPMRLVLDQRFMVRDSRPGDELLGQAEIGRLCSGGGIAANSLKDVLNATPSALDRPAR